MKNYRSSSRRFSQYIEKQQQQIRSRHFSVDSEHNIDDIIYANSPFELSPQGGNKPKYGVLLIHGLLDSPFMLRDLAKVVYEDNALVRSVLLDGHGTQPKDLFDVSYQDWIKTAEWALADLQQEVESCYVVGYSTGANIATYLALTRNNVQGLICFAPALKISNPLIAITPFYHKLSWLIKKALWTEQTQENDYAKYQSCTTNAAVQTYHLGKEVRKIWKQKSLKTPLLNIITLEDETIDAQMAINYFSKTTNPNNQLVLYARETITTDDPRITQRSSTYPERRIIDFSHTCLAISPDNPHYGIHGDYRNLRHYRSEESHRIIKNKLNLSYGAITKKNRRQYFPLARLNYNPDFSFIAKSILNFIHKQIA